MSPWVGDDDLTGAETRAGKYRDLDPFPRIPRALLSSEHIAAYAQEAAMIWPAHGINKVTGGGEGGALKSASYETKPGCVFMHFDDHGRLVRRNLSKPGTIRLPANSITFVSTSDRFFLPNYIALRFNLRIKHVHRGLLLGTGPLVDPGYGMQILIPLHNLTDSDYHISTDEGLIWIEFTKTSTLLEGETAPLTPTPLAMLPNGPKLPSNTQKTFEEHLFKASGGFPIRSSLPTALKEAKDTAEAADRRSKLLQGIGILALVSFVIALVSVFMSILTLLTNTQTQLRTLTEKVAKLEEKADRAEKDRVPK